MGCGPMFYSTHGGVWPYVLEYTWSGCGPMFYSTHGGVWHGSANFDFCNHFTFDLLSGHLYQCYQREGHRVQIEAGEG